MSDEVLDVRDLTVRTAFGAEVIADVSLRLRRGEVLGIAGESGCGKSTLALALLGYHRAGLHIAAGTVWVAGHDVLALSERDRRKLRGRTIAYVAQDAGKSLNPAYRVRDLLREVMEVHKHPHRDEDVCAALQRVYLPHDRGFLRRFPHQLSGGQQQRLAIGMALACQPSVVVLDEPTTGLDVMTQANILDEVSRICVDEQVGAVFVSHDLAAMSKVAHRIAVMYAGRIVEEGNVAAVIASPLHPYSAGLVSSVPVHTRADRLHGIAGIAVGVSDRPTGCAFAPRCALRTDACEAAMPELQAPEPARRVRCLHWCHTSMPAREVREVRRTDGTELLNVQALTALHGRGDREVVAAQSVTFSIRPGECLALVGESGSGKSTIARCVAGLHQPAGGTIVFDGRPLPALARDRSLEQRGRLQIVFQNPYDSLNPSQTVEQAVARPLQLFGGLGERDARRRVPELMAEVRLPSRLASRYPSELSGGERQRVAIARALAAGPSLLVCDEVTSSLDVSVQAAVLDLLGQLQVAMLFITHDLGVVASIADRVLVLQRGVIREEGLVEDVLHTPRSDYARELIAAIPELPLASADSK